MENRNRAAEVAEFILERISSGEYRKGDKIPSEYELADMFNVNKTTANKAVGQLVTRGYLQRRRGAAGTVVIRDTMFPKGAIGFLVNVGQVSFYPKLLSGAQLGAFCRGYSLQYFNESTAFDSDYFWDCIRNSGISGLLVSHMNAAPDNLPFPVIYVNDAPIGRKHYNWVGVDNYQGGYLAGKHLAQLGHENVVYIRQNRVGKPLIERYRGFCDAMSEAGIPAPREYAFNFELSNVETTWENIKRDNPDLTAIGFDGDHIALHFYNILKAQGVRVPEDISITGFSGLPEVSSVLRITTVDEKPEQLGYFAAEKLLDLIEEKVELPIWETVPVELSYGDTTCPPRSF